jgi:hypothetical protein
MQRGRPDPNSGQNLPVPLSVLHATAQPAQPVQQVKPMQQFQGQPKPMAMQPVQEVPQQRQIDPAMQRRLMAFRGVSR